MRSYSPYLLDQYQRCPKLYDLSKRWVPRVREEDWQPYLVLGSAFAKGIAAYRSGRGLEASVSEALLELQERYVPQDEWKLEGLLKHVTKGLEIASKQDLNCSIVTLEQQYGHCIPDVVGRDAQGRLVTVDDKFKLRLERRYLEDELQKWETSNQLFQQAYEVGLHYGESVYRVSVNLVVINPVPYVHLHTVPINADHFMYWLEGVLFDFDEMERIDEGKLYAHPRWTGCIDQYKKKCPMYGLCHNLYGNEELAETLYDRR